MTVRYYKIRVETPRFIMQTVDTTWAGLEKADYLASEQEKWNAFGKRYGIKVDLQIEEISEDVARTTRQFTRHRKVKP